MEQGSHCIVVRTRIGSVTHVRLSGAIDETFSPTAVATDLMGQVILDLGRLERISSFGVRKWIEFASKLPQGALGLYLIHAPPSIVDQLNLVEGFAGVATVLSVLAPYRCNACNEDRVRLVEMVKDAAAIEASKAPEHVCPVCGGPLEFADMPAEFFDYVRTRGVPEVDPAVEHYLASFQMASKPESATNVVKMLQDDITFFRLSGTLESGLNVRRLSSGLEGRVVYDFGNVAAVDPGAAPKLLDVLHKAAGAAQVILWRMPPPVFQALAKLGSPLKVGLASLWLPAECRNCGSKVSQRVLAFEYVNSLETDTPVAASCSVCGGEARIPLFKEAAALISGSALPRPPGEELESLENRAFSQYLSGGAPDHTPTRSGSASGIRESGAMQLQVLKRLGQGGMAEVFLARQLGVKGFEKYVVVKKILPQFAESPEFVEMLFAEARANARLNHPNIVQTFDVGMMDGVAYITMEYVRGPDVKKLLVELRKKGRSLPLEHALRIVAETAAGLHFAHSYVDPTGKPHPMVHRDVSPHNILISLDGAIKLSDFGIAKVQGESENTQAGVLKGKIAYISPEAVSGMQLDGRNDVFALGVVMFELLTGKLPFKRENDAATLRAIVREPPPDPSQLNPSVPKEISAIVLRALEKDPAWRIQSAAVLREEIESAMVKQRLNSSPFLVAKFFQEALGERLSIFQAPGSAAAASSPSLQVASPSVPSRTRTPSIPVMVETTDAAARKGGGTRPMGAVSPGANRLPPGKVPTASRPAIQQATPQPPANGAHPSVPPLSAEPPSEGGPTAVLTPRPDLPRPDVDAASLEARSAAHRFPHPPTPSPEIKPNPPTATTPARPAAVPAPPQPASPPTPRKGGVVKWVVAAVGVVAIIGGVAFVTERGPAHTQVLNLPPEAHLYIDGVRVNPSMVIIPKNSTVSTAINGSLRKFGNYTGAGALDVTALLDAGPGARSGQEAHLKIDSRQAGCTVLLGGAAEPKTTPGYYPIETGKELLVQVRCPGAPAWQRYVMAVSGQQVGLEVETSSKSAAASTSS